MAETWCAGVDGCRGGWFVALLRFSDDEIETVQHRLCRSFDEVVELAERPVRVAVDMPIGLLERGERGGRLCDRAARILLHERRSSIFSPPVRAALSAKNYSDALAINRASSDAGLGISRQAFGILDKINEVDKCMTPLLQARIVESHPELAFLALAGRPMRHHKKRDEGRRERLSVLRRHFGTRLPDAKKLRDRYGRHMLAQDDVLDACALALTARRVHLGRALRLPEDEVPLDSKGLRMEIWY